MKKSKFLTASVLIALTGCTVSDEVFTGSEGLSQQQQDENAISFGTYLGKSGTTRAGATGNMNTDKLKTTAFGVFAYHTPNDAYSHYTYWNTATSATNATLLTTNYASAIAANFMFNQKVEWNTTAADYVTGDGTNGWYYTPVKYWPNDFNSTDVDDQENDNNDNVAYGSGNNGNVSFFAYAPYVDFSTTDATTGIGYTTADPHGDSYGIVAINGKTTISDATPGNNANTQESDPILTYKLSQTYPVDLLWGTKGNTSTNVNGEEPTSYYTKQAKAGVPSIYPVNVNLTKQRTNGVVDFNFKHALASLGGGSGVSSGIGFQVMLDIDDMKGKESSGSRETFDAGSGSADAWRTIVTIKSIEVSNDLNKSGSIDGSELGLFTQGDFNLATGEWTGSSASVVEQLIGDEKTDPRDAKLNTKIAEYYDGSNTWLSHLTSSPSDVKGYFKYVNGSSEDITQTKDGTHPGVMEAPINVYNDATQNPIFFIPGHKPVLRITVDYIVRTYDENLANKYSAVEQVISKKITFPTAFEINKHYNLIMHLGLTGVKFTASVDNWDEGYIADNDGDLTLESSDIYLPRNVGGLMLTFSIDATNAASTATSGNLAVVSAATYYIDATEKTVSPLSGLTLFFQPRDSTSFRKAAPQIRGRFSDLFPPINFASHPLRVAGRFFHKWSFSRNLYLQG